MITLPPIAKTVLSHLDPANETTPVLGPIRKFNRETFGQQDYANPNLPTNVRVNDAFNKYASSFMGHGEALPAMPVKNAFSRALAQEGEVSSLIKKVETQKANNHVGYTDPSKSTADIDLIPQAEHLWTQFFGGNKRAPRNFQEMYNDILMIYRDARRSGK